MALIHSLESNGNFLFKYRGQIPIVLFVLAVPVIYFTNYFSFSVVAYKTFWYSSIGVSLLGLIVRAIAVGTTPKNTSGRNREKQVADSLNSTGIYSTVRHPLYLGNYLMWIGIVLYTFNIYFVIIVSLAYWIYYERIMFAEERFLEKKFGQPYLDWSLKVPAFFPSFKNYQKNKVPFSFKYILKREYSGVLATVTGFLFVDVVRDYFMMPEFKFNLMYAYVFSGTLVFALILRSLKHYTRILHDDIRT